VSVHGRDAAIAAGSAFGPWTADDLCAEGQARSLLVDAGGEPAA
jgi:hypothetical protein